MQKKNFKKKESATKCNNRNSNFRRYEIQKRERCGTKSTPKLENMWLNVINLRYLDP